jgi:hypothetical protein
MARILRKKTSQIKKINEAVGRYSEAVTYAEAGLPEEAVKTIEAVETEQAKILVLGLDGRFSQALCDYAVGLAGRLGYEIVAVNAKHFPSEFLASINPFREKLKADFEAKAIEAAEKFETVASTAGVPFRHVIKYGEGQDVIKELYSELKKLEYVLTEPDSETQGAEGASPVIPVFSLAVR